MHYFTTSIAWISIKPVRDRKKINFCLWVKLDFDSSSQVKREKSTTRHSTINQVGNWNAKFPPIGEHLTRKLLNFLNICQPRKKNAKIQSNCDKYTNQVIFSLSLSGRVQRKSPWKSFRYLLSFFCFIIAWAKFQIFVILVQSNALKISEHS